MPETPILPGEKFQAVLAELGVVRVVCVDDQYASRTDVPLVVGWANALGNRRALKRVLDGCGIDIDPEDDTYPEELRHALNEEESAAIKVQAVVDRERIKRQDKEPLTEAERQLLTDRSVLGRLDELMQGFRDFRGLSPAQWNDQRQTILDSLEEHRTLFIFDENLGTGVVNGSEQIRILVQQVEDRDAYFGLLSYTIETGTEHERTREFQLEGIVATAISKRDLSSEKGIEHLQVRLRAAVMWREAKGLRELCKNALQSASEEAHRRVFKLTPLEFDEIVFRSSYKEGAHEIDTLVRVYTNALAASFRDTLRRNEQALSHIDTLRSYRGENIPSTSAGSTAWKLQREEYFEPADYINTCKMPPEPGDFYAVESSTGESADYVLVAPPCDLMVRAASGKRDSGAEEGLLCRVRKGRPPANQLSKTFELDLYERQEPAWVYFSEVLTVDLWLLDLCAINDRGLAHHVLGSEIPQHLSDGWKLRCESVLFPKCAELVASIQSWQALDETIKQTAAFVPRHEITLSRQVTLRTVVSEEGGTQTLIIGLQRLQRFTSLLQGELVRAYADYVARPARPHQLRVEVG